jgi:uncharacterized RDD family membrane protein YckC
LAEYRYAGFWVRFGALLIDVVIILIVTGIPLWFIYGGSYWTDEAIFKGVWDFLIGTVLPLVATVWLWHAFGATPGKMALRLKVLDARTGQTPSVPRSVGRYFAYFVSILPIFLGFVWVGIDKRKRGFHDLLAGTVVVRDYQDEPVSFDSAA